MSLLLTTSLIGFRLLLSFSQHDGKKLHIWCMHKKSKSLRFYAENSIYIQFEKCPTKALHQTCEFIDSI